MQSFLFWTIAGMTAGSAIATVVTHHIVRSATWLLFTLAGTSGLFFLIGADLVGAIQLLVYVGGTLILVVFGVMLTAQGPFVSMRTSSAEWGVTAATGISLLAVLLLAIFPKVRLGSEIDGVKDAPHVKFAPKLENQESATSNYAMTIGQGFSGVPIGPAHRDPNFIPPVTQKADGPVDVSGGIVRAHYLLPFELISVHLLVVLIGAAYLARAKRRRREAA